MSYRYLHSKLRTYLSEFPAVVLVGPRQVGKTTLALDIVKGLGPERALYLDLELPSALRQLDDAEGFFLSHANRLVVLDEVQRVPEIFSILRGVIDQRRRGGESAGQFLLLGSASGQLLGQASESLAGRTATLELTPFQAREIIPTDVPFADASALVHKLWTRGGFPLSYLAASDPASLRWREAFITTYLERDIPALGPRVPATTLRRLWTMLAHHQGQLLNQSQLAGALAISGQTVTRYIDLLCDLMLVRRLPAWSGNVGKRLVRAPKVYVRDSGLVHALLGLRDLTNVLAHPVAGASWEGWVMEQLLAAAPEATASFYRTSHGAEADLVLSYPSGKACVIEVKRSSAPTVSRGFHQAALDVQTQHKWLVAPVERCYSSHEDIQVMDPLRAVAELSQM